MVSYFIYVGLSQRRKASRLREQMTKRGGALLLPETLGEFRWFAAVSAGSGIAEESVYRGFLWYYLSTFLPHITSIELVVLSSLIFGLGHLYQGWTGVASTGLSGLILSTLYVSTGSLLLPVVIHSLGNMQGVLILWPESPRSGNDVL